MIRQFSANGLTHSLYFSFWGASGVRTPVNNPLVDILTPQKSKLVSAGALTLSDTVGKYVYNLFLPEGTTVGHYFARATGLTTNDTLYSESQVFEVIDYQYEPLWVGLEELRSFMELEDDENREGDNTLRQVLATALEAVEAHVHRQFGIRQVDETIQVKCSDRVLLKQYPVNSIIALTASYRIIPRDVNNLLTETVSDSVLASFFFRLDAPNGVLYLTDNAGFDNTYDDLLLSISYLAGFATIPEPVREAVLRLAMSLNNMVCTEGLSSVRLGDISFSAERHLFDGHIGDLLKDFMNNFQA